MKVPLLDLKAQYALIHDEIDQAVREVFASQQFILGSKVSELEEKLAAYTGAKYAVAVSSGTDALLMCLMDLEVGPGDEVITTPFSFFATAGTISRLGATPVFVDIDPTDYNIDVEKIEARVTSRTKAILPVHLYGQMANTEAISSIAARHGIAVIEDAAQALGAKLDRRAAGTVGDYGCFSFFPSKNLGAAGDAGLIVTNDPDKAENLRLLRGHGAEKRYYHRIVGGNFRIDALQAAVLTVKLKYLEQWIAARQRHAESYREILEDLGLVVAETASYNRDAAWREGGPSIYLPSVVTDSHVFHQFVVRVEERDRLKQELEKEGIGCEIYYPVPLHLQECFRHLGYARGDLPESECAAAEILALPIYPELTDGQISAVAGVVARIVSPGRVATLVR